MTEKRADTDCNVKLLKASLLKSALLLVSFAAIIIGAYLESTTDYVETVNSEYALNLVAPATAFLIGLVNWYFIRLYKSRFGFSFWSAIITFLCVFAVRLCLMIYYGLPINFDSFETAYATLLLCLIGSISAIPIAIILGAISGILSNLYAKYLGKES